LIDAFEDSRHDGLHDSAACFRDDDRLIKRS
jgi:hypothetical protein